jgi:hypothetical protein
MVSRGEGRAPPRGARALGAIGWRTVSNMRRGHSGPGYRGRLFGDTDLRDRRRMTEARVQESAEAPHPAEELWVPGFAAMAMAGLEEHLFRAQ